MKAASLSELKKELNTLDLKEIVELCMRLTKYKKENKELLSYLLFDAGDEDNYVEKVKEHINEQFDELPRGNLYLANKSLRKVLRITNKYIKYSGSKKTEAELLIYFCLKVKKSGIRIASSTALSNLYERQLAKIEKAIAKLHEDLQYDYQHELENLL